MRAGGKEKCKVQTAASTSKQSQERCWQTPDVSRGSWRALGTSQAGPWTTRGTAQHPEALRLAQRTPEDTALQPWSETLA